SVRKEIKDILDAGLSTKKATAKIQAFEPNKPYNYVSVKDVQARVKELEAMMYEAAQNLEFEKAGVLRDEIKKLRADFIKVS
ncbi:Helicase subunit of the DNA excision repair complex, partial [Gilliamella apicola SCGC AB-598-B02]